MAATSITLRRQQDCGELVLRADGPRTGESFEDWIGRVGGDSAGWRDERSAMRDELQRLSELWLARGFIQVPRDKRNRIVYEHARGVKAAWRKFFGAHIGVDCPPAWCNEVPAFNKLWLTSKRHYEERKKETGALMKRHMMGLQYEDAVELAEGCLASAAAASKVTERYKFLMANQTIAYGLTGARCKKLLAEQTFGTTFFHTQFGAGTNFASELFRFNPSARNPPAIDLQHTPKMGIGTDPLVLIPGRIFPLCPLVSTGLVRLVQYGKRFLNKSPPAMQPGVYEPDLPYLTTKINDIFSVPKEVDNTALDEVAQSLGLPTTGGTVSQLRHLGTLKDSSDPSCSADLAHLISEHNRKGVAACVYRVQDADAARHRAHFKGSDPRNDAYLCAVTDLLSQYDSELTEMALSLLSDGFRAHHKLYLSSDQTGVARGFFETTLFCIKLVLIRSRCRMCEGDFQIYEESAIPLDKYKLLGTILRPVLDDPFFVTIDEVIARHENREIALGINAALPATTLQSMDSQQRANVDSMKSLLTQQTAHIRGYTLRDMDALEEERDSGLISEAEFQQRLADARPRDKGSPVEERIVSRLSPDGFALRHSLPMRTEEERRRAADLLEERREDFYPRDIYADAEALASRFDTGKKRERDGTPKPLPLRPPPARPAALPPLAALPPPAALPPSLALPPALAPAPAAPPARSAFEEDAEVALGNCTLNGPVAKIVGTFVHGLLPFLVDGREHKLSIGTNKVTLQRQRDILFKALSLTVDAEGEPQPSRLASVLNGVTVSGSKHAWAKGLDSSVQDRMRLFVFGNASAYGKPNFAIAQANLKLLQAGIPEPGASHAEPPPLPAAAPPAPAPSERFYVACDPGIAKSDFGVARIFVDGKAIVRVEYDSFHLPARNKKVNYTVQGQRMLFLKRKLEPIIRGAKGVFVESYRVNPRKVKGAGTNFFVRSVPIVLASEAGIPVEDILMQKWRKSFGGKAANLRTQLARHTKFDFDAIESDDAIDAIGIGLHCLLQRGFSLAVRSLAPM